MDAKDGFAQAAFSKGLQSAVKSAKENGICLFVIAHSHTCTSLGYFTAQIAKTWPYRDRNKQMHQHVFRHREVINRYWAPIPISMAIPSPDKTVAFQFDQSTSAIAIGKIRMAAAANESIPEGWAIDKDGNPTTDAEAALGGSLLSSGGYKGYGFGLMAEVLASALTGSVSSINAPPLKTADGEPHSLGQSYILIDPDFNGKKRSIF